MRFLFTFRQSVDAWRKFANCASIVIMLKKIGMAGYRNIYFTIYLRNKARSLN